MIKTDTSRALLHEAQELGHEARLQSHDHAALKLWLRMLACTTQVEAEIRRRLRAQFGISLARFDYMAQLYRHRDGLKMKALSRFLMVTGGNVTGLTDQLVKEGLVQRVDDPEDRRSWRVSLTDKGRAEFALMAAEHEKWLTEMFTGLAPGSKEALYEHLGRLRVHLVQRQVEIEAAAQETHMTQRRQGK